MKGVKGVGGLQGRKWERKIRPLTCAQSCPLSPTRSSSQAGLEPTALYQQGAEPREGKDPGHTALPGGGDFLRAQNPAVKSSSVPPVPSPKSATTNRTKAPERSERTRQLGTSWPPLGATDLLTSESGQGAGWPGMGPVMSPLPHQYLYPQTHPGNKTGIRGDKKGVGPLLESRTSAAAMCKATNTKRSQVRMGPGLQPAGPGLMQGCPLHPARQDRGLGPQLTSCSESVPDSFLSLPLLPMPPFFRLPPPGFRPLREGGVHLPRGLPTPLPSPKTPPTPGALAFPTWTLTPHLRGPLSPSMWLSSPSPCMSGTEATRSFKKSNCCSSSMHCFLEEVGREWHSGEAQMSVLSAKCSLDVRGTEPGSFQSQPCPLS